MEGSDSSVSAAEVVNELGTPDGIVLTMANNSKACQRHCSCDLIRFQLRNIADFPDFGNEPESELQNAQSVIPTSTSDPQAARFKRCSRLCASALSEALLLTVYKASVATESRFFRSHRRVGGELTVS